MIFPSKDKYSGLRIVNTQPGPHTAGGPGDILTDERGGKWVVVPDGMNEGTAVGGIRKIVNGRIV